MVDMNYNGFSSSFKNLQAFALMTMTKLMILLTISFLVCTLAVTRSERLLFSWDYDVLRMLRAKNKLNTMPSRTLSSSLLKLWIDSNDDVKQLSEKPVPSVYQKEKAAFGTAGDKSYYTSVVPYAFPCNNRPSGCKDYFGNKYHGLCRKNGLPWVICDGHVRYMALSKISNIQKVQ